MSSQSSYGIRNDQFIPVIAAFDTSGKIAPLYIRINNESFKILSYHQLDTMPYEPLAFRCRVEDHNMIRIVTLRYRPRDCIWSLHIELS